MKVHFLRNTSPSPNKFVDGFQTHDPLEYVGAVSAADVSPKAACELAFAKFNCGSGQEVEFDGPSMSVGDVAVIRLTYVDPANEEVVRAFSCQMMGWKEIPTQPRFVDMLEEVNQ